MHASRPLRCEEVTAGLSAPGAGAGARVDQAAVAAHLAACPDCAAWAERAAALDRLWDATRPAEPADETWDALWANVTATLDRLAPAVVPGTIRLRSWRRPAVALVLLAQAAAVLAAVTFWA